MTVISTPKAGPAKAVEKDAAMTKQKEMMNAHYERLTSAPVSGAKVCNTFVPGNLGVIFASPSFCDPALLDRPMLQHVLKDAGIPYIAFKYAENSGQMQPIREQAGTFADSIKLWSGA